MDFLQVYDIKIPEGSVKYLDSGSTRLWQKPSEQPFIYPGRYIALENIVKQSEDSSSDSDTHYIIEMPFLINRDNITTPINDTSYRNNSNYYNYRKTLFNASFCQNYINVSGNEEHFSLNKWALTRSTRFVTGIRKSEKGVISGMSDAIWSFSDETTGKIQLFAYPIDSLRGYSNVTKVSSEIDNGVIDVYNRFVGYPKYETEVTVDAGEPFIVLKKYQGRTAEISSMRSAENLGEYNTKYDIATAGKYSKNEYPYLGGYVDMKIESSNEGVHDWGGYRIYFLIGR